MKDGKVRTGKRQETEGEKKRQEARGKRLNKRQEARGGKTAAQRGMDAMDAMLGTRKPDEEMSSDVMTHSTTALL